MEDFKRFINSILLERTATPLYATFTISWLVCNPKIVYATLFVDSTTLPAGITKLQYVLQWVNWCNGLVYPLIGAVMFIFVLPHLANYTYEVSLKRQRERIDKKNEIIFKDRVWNLDQVAKFETETQIRLQRKEQQIKDLKIEAEALENRSKILTESLNDKHAEEMRFSVLFAKYGNDDSYWVDVTKDLNKGIFENTSLKVVVSDNAFTVNDPSPGYIKELIIVYRYDKHVRVVRVFEGDVIRISIDSTEIIKIEPGDKRKMIIKLLEESKAPFRLW